MYIHLNTREEYEKYIRYSMCEHGQDYHDESYYIEYKDEGFPKYNLE